MSKEIKQVKVIHMAFEDKAKHIATYVPEDGFQNVKDMLEDVFKFTQNLNFSFCIQDTSLVFLLIQSLVRCLVQGFSNVLL